MKVVSLLRGVFYIDGQPVPASTAYEFMRMELAKAHYEIDALKASNESLERRVERLSKSLAYCFDKTQ